MTIKDCFEKQAMQYADLCNKLHNQTESLGEKIIIMDILQKYKIQLKHGFNVLDMDSISEVCIEGRTINLISKAKEKYKAYVLYFEKDFNFPYLGFMYKKDIISLHTEDSIKSIKLKYNEDDLMEITKEIDKKIKMVKNDLTYIDGASIEDYKYYYKNYNGLFEGNRIFDTFNTVIKDYLD